MSKSISSELPITFRAPEALLDAIDRYRLSQDDAPSRPEAVRRLLQLALDQLGQSPR